MEDYQDYDLEDFLADEEFIRYVLRPDPDRTAFWEQWQERHPEKITVLQEARFIIRHARFKEAPQDPQQYHTVLGNVLGGTYSNRHVRSVPAVRRALWVKVAAAIAVLAVASVSWWYLSHREATPVYVVKANPAGARSSLRLADGTQVNLNAMSSLRFPETFDAQARPVALSGEAYFEVAHDSQRPFQVHIGNLIVTALGTAFNIKAFEEDENMSVSLVTGKVRVQQYQDGQAIQETILTPGQKVTVDKVTHTFRQSAIHPDEYAWKRNLLVFESADLAAFIQSIERWYGITVQLQGTPQDNWSFTGRFENQTLHSVLEGMSYTKNFRYTIHGTDVTLQFTP